MWDLTVQQVAYHRNGICGAPFYVVTFSQGLGRKNRRKVSRNMVGIVFPGEGSRVAVFDRDKLGAGEVAFGVNSFRGDLFERVLLDAIAHYEQEQSAEIERQNAMPLTPVHEITSDGSLGRILPVVEGSAQ